MSNVSHPLWGIFEALQSSARPDGRALVVACVSAFSQAGTSYVARNLSLLAAEHYVARSGRVALFDMDLNQQTQLKHFKAPDAVSRYGEVQGPFDATFAQSPFWQVSPDLVAGTGGRLQAASYCGLFFIGDSGLAVSEFDWDKVKSTQTVLTQRVKEYWEAARSQFSFILCDCPALDRSQMSWDIIPEADLTVIISPQYSVKDPVHSNINQNITHLGGQCAGLIINEGRKIQEFRASPVNV